MKHTINDLALDAKPREKLMKFGEQHLCNEELIAIIIGSGNTELNAIDLSRLILQQFNNQFSELARASLSDLLKIKGIGPAKAISLLAAFELGRRKAVERIDQTRITCSDDVFEHFKFLQDLPHEEFWVCFLSQSNSIIKKQKFSQGGVSGTVVDVKMIAKEALNVLCSGVILIHNHPSRNTQPSHADKQLTKKLKEGLAILDIQVLDHLIVAGNSYTSFADEGLL